MGTISYIPGHEPQNSSIALPADLGDDDRKGNSGGGGDDMLQRVKDLEKDVQQIKTDIAVMRSNYATKSDVSDAKTSIIIWVVGAVVFSQVIPAIPNILKIFIH